MRKRLLLIVGSGLVVVAAAFTAPRFVQSLPSRGFPLLEKDTATDHSLQPVDQSVDESGRLDPANAVVAPEASEERHAWADTQRGISLGLFAEDVSFDYTPLLKEIVEMGATHVQLVVPIYQAHGESTRLALHTRFSPSLAATGEAIRAADRLGLKVLLFPIVRLADPKPGQWRGTLAPKDVDAWFESYSELLGNLAAMAAVTRVASFAIGSELSSLDHDVPRWQALIERIRAIYPGKLIYSANWDHYQKAALLDLVDEAGIVAYFRLRPVGGPSDIEVLETRWNELRKEIELWRADREQPFIFTEVGYRSMAGASASPWDETPGGTPDVREQQRAFEAFRRVWASPDKTDVVPGFEGLYVWNWYGYGGKTTTGYTPRGKPAAEVVRRLLAGL